MTVTVCTPVGELTKKQSQCELGDTIAENPKELTIKSEKSKSKLEKQTVIQVQIKEMKVKATAKAAPASRKSNKKRRSRMTKMLSRRARNQKVRIRMTKRPKPPSKKSSMTRKDNARYHDKNKSLLNLDSNGEKIMLKRPPRKIPLVLPSSRPRAGIVRSTVKYTLKRAESNRVHRMRVLSNKRRFGRRNRTTTRKTQFRIKYLADYWKEPQVRLDDLSSLDCGSYSENVDKLSSTEEVQKVKDLYSLEIPSDFVFNINAPEFIPKVADRKRANIFTLSELVESLKGQKLPSMPELDLTNPTPSVVILA